MWELKASGGHVIGSMATPLRDTCSPEYTCTHGVSAVMAAPIPVPRWMIDALHAPSASIPVKAWSIERPPIRAVSRKSTPASSTATRPVGIRLASVVSADEAGTVSS